MKQRARRPMEERFWEKVERKGEDECWPWKAFRDRDGYGKFGVQREGSWTHVAASRIALELSGVVIPGGFCAMHTCDNPPCCNPKHLIVGSPLDNARDMASKGRGATGAKHGSHTQPHRWHRGAEHWSRSKPESIRRGGNHQNAKLTEDAVLRIKEGMMNGEKRKDLAARFGVKVCTLDKIATNKLWTHVPWPLREVVKLYLQDPLAAPLVPSLDAPQQTGVEWATQGEKVAK